MSWHSIKVRANDTQFSRYIRLKHKKCQRCGRKGDGEEGIFGLQAAHYHSRKKESVRFDPKNVSAICISCHRYFHQHPTEHTAWMKELLGEREYDLLTIRANTPQKRDDAITKLYVKQLLSELEQ